MKNDTKTKSEPKVFATLRIVPNPEAKVNGFRERFRWLLANFVEMPTDKPRNADFGITGTFFLDNTGNLAIIIEALRQDVFKSFSDANLLCRLFRHNHHK